MVLLSQGEESHSLCRALALDMVCIIILSPCFYYPYNFNVIRNFQDMIIGINLVNVCSINVCPYVRHTIFLYLVTLF